MARISENSHWSENIYTAQTVHRSFFWLVGTLLLAGCGLDGGNDFFCQGLGANTVSGTVRYEKRLHNQNGFTRSVFVPVRFAPVTVRGPTTLLANATTDDQGRYCATYVKTGGPTLNSVAVLATNALTKRVQVGFLYDDSAGETRFAQYAIAKDFDERQGGTAFSLDLNFTAKDFGGVFNIRDVLATGLEFFRSATGKEPPLVTAIWQQEVGGTFFTTQKECNPVPSDCIFVRGDGDVLFDEVSGDRDEYDDDVILHEYGHFIANNFSKDDSRGGTHFLGDHSQDTRLSWSEGWATFFSSAVRNNPVSADIGVTGEALFSFSIESDRLLSPPITPEPLNRDAIYTTSEIAVASVLWDIFDGLGEGFDSLSLGFGPIWNILGSWNDIRVPPRITMEAFWDSFGSVQPSFLNITNDRKMEFFRDSFENDDAPNPNRKATLNNQEHHTLFPISDIDYIAFNAVMGQTYTVETLNLTNGADTFLEILDGDGQTVLARNDDLNQQNPDSKSYQDGCNTWAPVCVQVDSNGICLDTRFQAISSPSCPNGPPKFPVRDGDTHDNPFPSRIIFTAPSSGTFYAKVYRSLNAPPSTGHYGSYDFRITSP